jgi:hypothetical protein
MPAGTAMPIDRAVQDHQDSTEFEIRSLDMTHDSSRRMVAIAGLTASRSQPASRSRRD